MEDRLSSGTGSMSQTWPGQPCSTQHLIYWQGQRVYDALLKSMKIIPPLQSELQCFMTAPRPVKNLSRAIYFYDKNQCHGIKMRYKEYFIHIFYSMTLLHPMQM
jgi:hypothetical protein